jgi:hypothetical protein
MKYLLLLYAAPENMPDPGAHMDRWMSVTEEMGTAGVLVAGDALQGPDTATTLRDGTMTDGPFAETKEILGGYYLVDVADLDAAAEWSAKLPIAEYGSIEIRPIQEYPQA